MITRDDKLIRFAQEIRAQAVRMVTRAKGSHIGGALSVSDLLAVIYSGALRCDPTNPSEPNRDRFILSKGHCCSSLYATLALRGFFPIEELETYATDASRLMSHVSHKVPGVEFSTGSLGHGLPFGCGKALAGKRQKKDWRVFVMLSDGELDEGSNWEALLSAPQLGLDNLVAIIDYNKIQSLGTVNEVMTLDPLADKLRAFRWAVQEIDGHNLQAIQESLATLPWVPGKPSALIAHTVKGKGVSFMENDLAWHYKSPSLEQAQLAEREIFGL